jgi:hypothetical protein
MEMLIIIKIGMKIGIIIAMKINIRYMDIKMRIKRLTNIIEMDLIL